MLNRSFVLSTLSVVLSASSLRAQVAGTIDRTGMTLQSRQPQGAAPQNLTATPTTPTSVRLSWTPTSGATGYLVYRGKSPDALVPPLATVPPTPTTAVTRQPVLRVASAAPTIAPSMNYMDAGVMPHSTVYYRVAATYDGQNPGTSDAVSATTPVAPQPTGFMAIAGPGSVTLFWHPAPGATSYMLSRDNSVFLNNQAHIKDTTYLDDGLSIQAHTYRLIAYYTVQGVGEVEGDLNQVPVAVATPRAVGPQGFHTQYSAGTIVDFEWDPVSGAAGYKVLRARASDGNFAEVPGMQYVIQSWVGWARDYNTVVMGETYLYKVVALYPDGSSGDSQVLRVEIKPIPPGVTNLTGSSPQPGTVVLQWTPAAGAVGYSILRGRGTEPMDWIKQAPWSQYPLTLPGNASSYTDTNLEKGITYRYTITTALPNQAGQNAEITVKVSP